MALADGGPQSQSRLVEIENVDHSTIAHSLRRMGDAGIVTRKPSTEDGRVTMVSLTPKGRMLHKKILEVWAELERVTNAGLAPERRAEFIATMKAVEQNVTEVHEAIEASRPR